MTPSNPVIGYAGMTHLGLNSAAAAAEKGFAVVAFDPDPKGVAALARGALPVLEPGLPELVARNAARLTFTAEVGDLARCDLVYIAVDVPTADDGSSDLTPIQTLLDHVTPVLKDGAVLAVLSQVPPGFTRRLERRNRPTVYQVETLIFGRAVERALEPERFILGLDDPAAPLPEALAAFLGRFHCPILPMRYESAELAKIAINCCLVASIAVANTLGELCERIGADWSEIAPSLKLDRRIGQHAYLAPGLGLAGGNLERDLATVIRIADEGGADAGVVRAWLANSRHRRHWALRETHAAVLGHGGDPLIAVWGLAYKPDTHSTKNAPSLALLEAIRPFRVRVHDPAVRGEGLGHPRLVVAETPLDACAGADVLVIMTPWRAYAEVAPADVAAALAGRVVIDPHGVLDAKACAAVGLKQRVLGRG